MMEDLIYKSGSLCQTYGHNWKQVVGQERGKHQCSTCKRIGYCRLCRAIFPAWATSMRCAQHGERQVQR